ncbi:LEA type 2 family protein [Marinomonas pollencensis]|uniref:Late embryogenesis abundant protein n=1 Tax=Marinomonas pollencensis TaxID=491954 RepID=A0A3E0DSU6_9GAMM|nr:LEA type 2 family protein [Marinomonas pollencensis]REG86629.1 late embryogenesis abundant protein [Marinomonas pollencensis]
MLLRWVFLLLVLLVSGCASLQETMDVHKPKASISGVSIGSLSADSVTLLLDVDVTNPNVFPLKTAGFDLGLLVGGNNIASINQPDSSLSLPAKGSNSVSLPVTLTFDQLLKSVSGLEGKKQLDYAVEGDVAINLPVLGDLKLPVDFSGQVPIPQKPEVAFKGVKMDSISLSGAKFSMDLEVTNPNDFDVNLSDISYQLASQGTSLGGGEISKLDLGKGQTQALSIPLTVGLSDMGMSAYRMLTSSDPVSMDVRVGANVDTDIAGWKPSPLQYETKQILTK